MRILALVDGSVSTYARLSPILSRLDGSGHAVYVTQSVETAELSGYNLVILQRPVYDTKPILLGRHLYGYKIVVDLDDDFSLLPPSHPGYMAVGEGNPTATANLEVALLEADGVVFSTQHLMVSKGMDKDPRCTVFPISWEDTGDFWDLQKYSRNIDKVQVGWAGTITHRDDFTLVQSALKQITKTFPGVRVVIGGDIEIYRKLMPVSEWQKLFIPAISYQIYPWMLAQFDVMLAPLLDNPFNRCKSDIKLLEAGIAGIPWVASPVVPYVVGLSGGGIRTTDWYKALATLVDSPARRKELGEQGREEVIGRGASKWAPKWSKWLEEVAWS